jgi:dGTPase
MYGAEDRFRQHPVRDDYRSAFARDSDRILYSSAFRRLAGKTQVVAVGELGDFHTRMTHSIKVAQVGRRMAESLRTAVARNHGLDERDPATPPSPDMVEAACLAHDLGHPPFGHAGEEALRGAVDAIAGDRALEFGGFEGNAQTFRILVRLSAVPPEATRGLNLTRATLDATIKYPWGRGNDGKPGRKWSAYPGDLAVAEWVRADNGWEPGARQCFEAQLMDWADDVTYACHDVEDFYKAGIIPLHALFDFPAKPPIALEASVPLEARRFFEFAKQKWTERGSEFNDAEVVEIWRELSQLMLLPGPYEPTRALKVAVRRSTSQLITHFLAALAWEGDLPLRHRADLVIDRANERRRRLGCDLLQELIWYYVIDKPALASQQYGQKRIVRELLSIYATEGNEKLLPPDRREELEEEQDLLRVAVDQVATLTEPKALALYHRFTGEDVGQHSDLL